MKINLMPPISPVRRYYSWWIGLIILLFSLLLLACGYLYYQQLKEMKSINQQLNALKSERDRAKPLENEYMASKKTNQAVLDYQATAERMRSQNAEWDIALSTIESASTPESRLFEIDVQGDQFYGVAAFHSIAGIQSFENNMKNNKRIKGFTIDNIVEASQLQELKIMPDTAKVVQFHFVFKEAGS
ncbi:hypothetical protein IC620_05340 [Hazenella sp. IB182357]|uniref:PilN domain-containing protein n=1 Tax=Polycladospora coralii TaxID=2771432 RepID=A0A926N8K5_9BACL|nr:hypothetical protein [Polycladospora coralii]MBD1371782.1 hypothetical protein [Polycladospora coralii]